MRPAFDSANAPRKRDDGSATAQPDDFAARAEQIERIAAAMAACEVLGDPELARHAGRMLLSVVACAADALLRDGGQALHAAPDKFGAFFDKAAAGYVQAIDGLAKRTALADAAGNGIAPGRPRAADPLAPSIAAWRAPKRE
jgi:hypothetical protein